MKSMEEMIKAAQAAAETIQKQMTETQGKLDGIEVEGVSGGGLVKIRCTAKGRVIGIAIDDSLMSTAEKPINVDRARLLIIGPQISHGGVRGGMKLPRS